MTWYATAFRVPDAELLSLDGRVLIHDSKPELEWLLKDSVRVVELHGATPEEVASRIGRPVMLWRDHPGMAPVRWPLNRRDFP